MRRHERYQSKRQGRAFATRSNLLKYIKTIFVIFEGTNTAQNDVDAKFAVALLRPAHLVCHSHIFGSYQATIVLPAFGIGYTCLADT